MDELVTALLLMAAAAAVALAVLGVAAVALVLAVVLLLVLGVPLLRGVVRGYRASRRGGTRTR